MEATTSRLCYIGLMVLFFASQAAATFQRRLRNDPNQRPRITTEYDWLCPKVLCQTLRDGCRQVEFFVFEHSFVINGKQVEIRCESCQYCIDAPTRLRRSRPRPDFAIVDRVDELEMCNRVECPFVPADCQHVLPVQQLVHNVSCRRCPACFDDTISFTGVRQRQTATRK